jgi:hypothetical protein
MERRLNLWSCIAPRATCDAQYETLPSRVYRYFYPVRLFVLDWRSDSRCSSFGQTDRGDREMIRIGNPVLENDAETSP